jgi:predicted DNA-binding protein YlxM (UPF0122 family)
VPEIDTSRALDLRLNHNLTYADIGDIFNTSKQAVHQKIKHLIPTKEAKTFRDNRADILSQKQLDLLAELDHEKIKTMSGKDLVVSAAVLYDKERLERNLTTNNVMSVLADLRQIRDQDIQEEDE